MMRHVVLISTKTEAELSRLAEEAGADGYLQKPFTPETLLAKEREYLPDECPQQNNE